MGNKSVYDQVSRLKNELNMIVKANMDSLNQERNARETFENNVKYQYENQLNLRLKKIEDMVGEDRSALQSLILYTKNMEQTLSLAQKDANARRDNHGQRLDELRAKMDDFQRVKEYQERTSLTIMDEIGSLKNKLDMQTFNVNSLSAFLKEKTKKLEEDSHYQLDMIRKQTEAVNSHQLYMTSLRTEFESSANETREMTRQLGIKLDVERDEKRKRIEDIQQSVHDEKKRLAEYMRTNDMVRRELQQALELEKSNLSALTNQAKDMILSVTNEKLDRQRDEFSARLRTLEKVNNFFI